MSKKGLDRKAAAHTHEGTQRRMLILDPEKCKPDMPAYAYLCKIQNMCDKECIVVDRKEKKCKINEDACLACLNRAKKTPDDAVRIINLPTNLETDTTHRYGENAFKLHGLPTPRVGSVLGLLGTNGIGKSTALNVLAGRVKPNLGNLRDPPDWSDILAYYRGSDLQNYFTRFLEEDLKIAIKVQLDADFVKRLVGRNVKDVLVRCDERKVMDSMLKELDLAHLVDREVQQLSGGELQRFAIACCAMRDADVYIFDEASSFLDVKQRMTATEVIRALCVDKAAEASEDDAVSAKASKYVVVVEHDLAVLDYMSDYICCLYGEPGAYGVVTKIASVRNGINNFLAGYIPAENMRFRAEALTFVVSGAEAADQVLGESGASEATLGTIAYPRLKKTLTNEKSGSSFTLNVEPGSFNGAEILGLLGENGCGKTTFMEMLAGAFDKKDGKGATPSSDAGEEGSHSLANLGVAYKKQNYAPKLRKFEGTVQELFERSIQSVCADRLFRLLVLRPMQMEALEHLYVKTLSGGELQRVAITLCLGTKATVYLLDEPSAGLDCEQRVIASKVIRRWIINHLRKTAFVIEHDFVMASALSDRVIVYTGEPGVECTAGAPKGLQDGFNQFLEMLDVTFRRDPANFRPRVNKKGSAKDREQKAAGMHFIFDADEEPGDHEKDPESKGPGGGGKKGGGKK